MAKKAELSIEKRKKVISLHQEHLTFGKIGKQLKIPKGTVQRIVEKWRTTGSVANRQGQGRKRSTTPREDAAIVRKVTINPRLSAPKIAKDVQIDLGINVHPQTIRRRLKSAGLSGEIAKRKPWISEKNRKKRLAWARDKVEWSVADWKKILFSDETKIQLFDGVIRVWRKPKESLKNRFLKPTVRHGGGMKILT